MKTIEARKALRKAHTSADAAYVAKLLLLNRRPGTTPSHAVFSGTVPNRNVT